MTVFKTFLKVLKKNKAMVIVYTVILLVFGGFNMSSNESSIGYVANKPSILIVNKDEEVGITKGFIEYIKENSKTPEIKNSEEARNDALFYDDVDYIIYIPENYHNDFMEGKSPEIEVKRRESYNSEFSEMLVKRYINVANIYRKNIKSENDLIKKVNETLSEQAKIEITSKLDTNGIQKLTFYYNFASYSILACLIYVISLVLFTFNEEKIRNRTLISSVNYKKHNIKLLLSNCIYSIIIWAIYVIAGIVLIGDVMLSMHGLLCMLNAFIFTICATAISFLVGTIVKSKGALSGIVNVVSLGSSFLCGVFVPLTYLPDFVVKIAHLLPTYYYVKNNEIISDIENINFETISPLLINMGIVILFAFIFVIITNIVARRTK